MWVGETLEAKRWVGFLGGRDPIKQEKSRLGRDGHSLWYDE